MKITQDFNLNEIIYNSDAQLLTFNFADNTTRVCVGITTVEDVLNEIEKILITNFC